MKLELKHLAPYLPYGLMFFAEHDTWQLTSISTVQEYPIWAENRWDSDKLICTPAENCKSSNLGRGFLFSSIQPILRPLSDLTKEMQIEGDLIVPKDYIEDLLNSSDMRWLSVNDISEVSYATMEKMFEWHFDVFGLIDAGLAIDVNSL